MRSLSLARVVHTGVLVAASLGIAACASTGRGAATPRLSGTYSARLQLTGRSTYTGTFAVETWVADSLRGSLRMVAPLAVEMVVAGYQIGDTLRLRGTYSAANGCTGTIQAPLIVARDLATATGPVTLTDRCVGALSGTMDLKR